MKTLPDEIRRIFKEPLLRFGNETQREEWRIAEIESLFTLATREVKREMRFQKAVMEEVADRCEDIADDIIQLPGWKEDGRLLGIKSVAEAQSFRLENLVSRLELLFTLDTSEQ